MTWPRRLLVPLLACVAGAGGCSTSASSAGPAVADAATDAIPDATVDSSTVDSSTVDSATVDSATVDSATVDSTPTGADVAPVEDAAGPPDAATAADAGPMPVEPLATGGAFVPVVTTNNADGTQMVPLASMGPSELALIYGPQGGHHIWITACVPAAVPGPIALTMALQHSADEAFLAPSPIALKTWMKDSDSLAGHRCRGPLLLYVDCPCKEAGKPLRLRVTLTGSDGNAAWLDAPAVAIHDATPCEPPESPKCK